MRLDSISPFKILDKVHDVIYKSADRVLSKLERTPANDEVISAVKEVKPFYNKFIPKYFRKTSKVEFYENSNIKKSEIIVNNKGVIIKTELFDKSGNSTYFETYNPKTKMGFVRTKTDNGIIEQTTLGNTTIKINRYNTLNQLTYLEKYDPKMNKRIIKTFSPNSECHTEYLGSEISYMYEKKSDSSVYEEITNFKTNQKLTKTGRKVLSHGSRSKHSQLTSVNIKLKDGLEYLFERIEENGTPYFMRKQRLAGENAAETRYFSAPEMREILSRFEKAMKNGSIISINE